MVNKKSVGKRLDALEERTFGADPFRDFPDWDLSDQLDCAAYTLQFYMRFHGDGRVRYPATDREAHMLGLLCAFLELPEGVGEHPFPSGVSVAWRDDNKGGHSASATRWIRLEDLPEWVRGYVERMDPAKQFERDRWLYADRHRAREHRELIMKWEADGAFEPSKEAQRSEEARRKDREFLNRNRAAVGLPPLPPEQAEGSTLPVREGDADRGEGGR